MRSSKCSAVELAFRNGWSNCPANIGRLHRPRTNQTTRRRKPARRRVVAENVRRRIAVRSRIQLSSNRGAFAGREDRRVIGKSGE